jgi:hypothetical protein
LRILSSSMFFHTFSMIMSEWNSSVMHCGHIFHRIMSTI